MNKETPTMDEAAWNLYPYNDGTVARNIIHDSANRKRYEGFIEGAKFMEQITSAPLLKEISGYKKVVELKNIEINGWQQRISELEKENDELKVVSNSLHGLMLNGEQRGYDKAAEEFYNQIESLKAENEGHKEIARARGEAINELQAENERLKWMMEQLSNGEAMNVVRESEGVYSVIFKTPKENS
jgi:hypothetical protein